MIVKDVTRLAKRLDRVCKLSGDVISVQFDYVGEAGVVIHMLARDFMHHFSKCSIKAVWEQVIYRYMLYVVVDGVKYITIVDKDEIKKYGIDVNERGEEDERPATDTE